VNKSTVLAHISHDAKQLLNSNSDMYHNFLLIINWACVPYYNNALAMIVRTFKNTAPNNSATNTVLVKKSFPTTTKRKMREYVIKVLFRNPFFCFAVSEVNLFEHELKDEELEVVNGLKLFFSSSLTEQLLLCIMCLGNAKSLTCIGTTT